MAKGTTTLTEVREQETANTLKWVGIGAAIILFAVFMIYFLGLFLKTDPTLLKIMRAGMGLGILAGAAVIGGAVYRQSQLRNIKGVTFPCPYCDATNQLVAEPTSDFECETCHQTVRFDQNGKMVPVRVISCSNCNTDNRISVKASRFICSKCNATVQVQAEQQPVYGMGNVAPAAAPARPATLLTQTNQDVLIQSFDPSRESQLAQMIQELLGVEGTEARRLLGTIAPRKPLIIGVDMPQMDAERLQIQLSQLGATVHLRAS